MDFESKKLLRELPKSSRSSIVDGEESHIWSKNGYGMRIKFSEDEVSMNEYENRMIGETRTMISTRSIIGLEIVRVMAKKWVETHWAPAAAPAQGT